MGAHKNPFSTSYPASRRLSRRSAGKARDQKPEARKTASIYRCKKYLRGAMEIIYAKNVDVADKESKNKCIGHP
jgi:hypothetical protein